MTCARAGTCADVAVVGAGITGLAIAWYLAESGAAVDLVDGAGIGSGATAIQPGGVRQQWGTRVACIMAREAFSFYAELVDRLQAPADPGFTACGYLFLAHSPEALAEQRARVELQNELGIPSRVVTPDEAGELAVGLDTSQVVGATWCEQDGYFDRPQAVVSAFADAARRSGVRLVDRHVVGLDPDGSGWRLSLRGGDSTGATSVVIAIAHDTPALLAPLGVELPIEREPRYLFYSNPIRQRLLEPLVVSAERHFAAKHLADGSVLASDLSAGSVPAEGREDWHRNVRAAIRELVPVLDFVPFPVLVEGFYDTTPDRQPVLGRIGGYNRLWIAAGLNGRGLMMAPAVGRILAAGVLTGDLEETISVLGPERFTEGSLEPEAQIV